jgi:hypothetical protein
MKQQKSDYELIFLFDVSFGSFMLGFMHLSHVRCWNVMVICIPPFVAAIDYFSVVSFLFPGGSEKGDNLRVCS